MTSMNPGESRIEKMLGISFASDPRLSKFPLPRTPENHPTDRPYPHPAQEISPQVAKDWLTYRVIRKEVTPRALLHDKFCANRRFIINNLKGSTARKGLVDTIKDGEWNPAIAQGIAFTPDGFLLDGQHRLAACVLAGKAIEVPVSTNTPWETFAVTDAGRARTAGQLIDLPYADYCSSIAKYLMPGVYGTEREDFQYKAASRQETIDLVMGWPLFQGPWMNQIMLASQSARIPAAPLGAATIAALAVLDMEGRSEAPDAPNEFRVQAFLDGLKKSFSPTDYTSATDPRWQIRLLFQGGTRGDSGGRVAAPDQRGNAGVLRRAMTLWLENKEISQIARTPSNRALPPFWHGEKLAEYHEKHVN